MKFSIWQLGKPNPGWDYLSLQSNSCLMECCLSFFFLHPGVVHQSIYPAPYGSHHIGSRWVIGRAMCASSFSVFNWTFVHSPLLENCCSTGAVNFQKISTGLFPQHDSPLQMSPKSRNAVRRCQHPHQYWMKRLWYGSDCEFFIRSHQYKSIFNFIVTKIYINI